MKYKLPAGYVIKEIPDNEEFGKLWLKPGKDIFNDRCLFYFNEDLYTKKELSGFKKLREQFNSKHHDRLNLALYYKNKFVGWSWGYQETANVFYMCNSAILEKYRGKGLYTCLAKEMVRRACEKGYMKIYSRHIMTNNEILIPKLKMGFKVTSFELSDAFGAMIHLTYYPHQIKNDILDFRSGLKRPNKKMKKIFKL